MRALLIILLLSLMLPRPLLAQGGHADACHPAMAGVTTTPHEHPAMATPDHAAMHHVQATTGTGDCPHCNDCQAQMPLMNVEPSAPMQHAAPHSGIAFYLSFYRSPAIDRLDRPPAAA